MSDNITENEKNEVRQVLRKIYVHSSPTQFDNFNVTLKTYVVIEEMINESAKCTRVMHMVPRYGLPANPISYASKQVRDGLRRFLLSNEARHYISCLSVVAAKYRTPLYESEM